MEPWKTRKHLPVIKKLFSIIVRTDVRSFDKGRVKLGKESNKSIEWEQQQQQHWHGWHDLGCGSSKVAAATEKEYEVPRTLEVREGKESKGGGFPWEFWGMGEGNQGNTTAIIVQNLSDPRAPQSGITWVIVLTSLYFKTFSEYSKWAYDCFLKNGAAFGMMPWRLSQGVVQGSLVCL